MDEAEQRELQWFKRQRWTKEVVDSDAIRWERTNEEIATMQEEDEIAQVFFWAGAADEMSDMPSLGRSRHCSTDLRHWRTGRGGMS